MRGGRDPDTSMNWPRTEPSEAALPSPSATTNMVWTCLCYCFKLRAKRCLSGVASSSLDEDYDDDDDDDEDYEDTTDM